MNFIPFFFAMGFIVVAISMMMENWGNDCGPSGKQKLPIWKRLLPYGLLLVGILFACLGSRVAHAQDAGRCDSAHAHVNHWMLWLSIGLAYLTGAWVSTTAWLNRLCQKRPPARRFIVITLLALAAIGCASRVHAQTVRVPDVNARLRLQVEQAAADEWGVDASPARLAAQLHQESSWNPNARSSVGAEGLAQIMPKTGQWLAQQFPQIGAYDPWDAAWSARAAAVYDHWLLQRNTGAGACSSWAFAFSAYNGGETLLHKEQLIAAQHGKDGKRWFGNTANYSARSQASWQQNRDYVHRILIVLEPSYIKAGWSGSAVCV